MRTIALRLLLILTLILTMAHCAKRSTPTGGPEDLTPPSVISASPENETTNFSTNTIRITFDEYVKLKDLQKQLVVSPPLKYKPNVFPQGSASKYIEIEIQDTLLENTTYVFNFGQSVVDNTEENPYPFLSYVFSTGDVIDSLTLQGVITDAVLPKAETFVSVMLYAIDSSYTDSVIYQKPPTYITNTLDSSAVFTLTNLKEGKYMLLAMKDAASNNLFNPETDKIGFIPTPVTVPSDTVYELKLFSEIPPYRAVKPSLMAKNKIAFGYEGSPEGMQINLLGDRPDTFTSAIVPDPEKDTLNYFFTPFETDSLLFEVVKGKQKDTFNVRTRDLYPDSLLVGQDRKNAFALNRPFVLQSSLPIQKIDTSLIQIIRKDSVFMPFRTLLDTTKTKLSLQFKSDPQQSYGITLFPGAVTDMFGGVSDTLSFKANTKGLADLGSITVALRNINSFPIILQLTNEKGEVAYEEYLTSDRPGGVEFRNISPGSYRIRVIYDTNANQRWDTGSFLERRPPERISYLPETVELRANWEIEQVFILQP